MIQSPLDYSAVELEFIVCGQGVQHRSRRVLFQQGTQSTTCTCRKWETEGLICRHMFKVFFTINIRRLPEQHILKRWRRTARNRSPNNIITPTGGDILDDLLFVNNTMRLAYAIAYECKDNVNYRSSLHQCMTLLFNQVCGSQNQATSSTNIASGPSDMPHSCGIRNPPTTNHAWYPRQRGGGRKQVHKKSRNTKKGGATISTTGQDNAVGMDPHQWIQYNMLRNNLPGSMDYDACMETDTGSVTPSHLVIPTQSSVHNRGDR
ncbi:hypothetical protein C2S52_017623 [Perilla frutescens var. hirtella]|nr:hypothetical protein C2S52_017623 [Perilla frutescens var. hirtella]